ncbi:ATP-dependent helicase HrpB [Desulfobulbus propionicus]
MPLSPAHLLPELPIRAVLPELRAALARGSAVLAAPPGSGKTTVVPLALLKEPWLKKKKILILEPRRLATRAAAVRMASLLGETVGQSVGYQVRFDRRISAQTRIEVVTEGILTRRLQNDAGLENVGLVIFDEFHERSLHADLALALCLDLCQLREDLRLLVMSATLDTAPIARLLGGAPVVTGQGRMFAVETTYLDRPARERIAEVVAGGVRRMLPLEGDLLVFLPGSGEIRETMALLQDDPALNDRLILPLFGELSVRDQDRAIVPDPEGQKRIILATAIAETSLTIEGIRCVIDSGWSRLPAFDPASGLSRLNTVRVSRATAAQRTGRAGRLGPGQCLRLWTREEQHSLPPFHPPEIVNADLAELALELALWGVRDPGELRWLDLPRSGPLNQARDLLRDLQAIDRQGRITPLGRTLAELPLHPRLAHMLLQARTQGLESLGCDLAALLSERDPWHGRAMGADIGERLRLLAAWREQGERAVRKLGGDPHLCRRVDQASRQWQRDTSPSTQWDQEDVGNLLIAAYPERIARRRPGQRERYQLAGGRGVSLPPTDPLAGSDYLVAALVDGGHGEGRIFLAASVDLAVIRRHHPHLLVSEEQVRWDMDSARVIASSRTRLGALVVEEHPLSDLSPQAVRTALLQGIRTMGLACLPWSREARQVQARLVSLRRWQPEANWPDLNDSALLNDLCWLEPFVDGITRIEQLQRLDLQQILLAPLDWPRRQALDRLAPRAIVVPSGSTIRIDYQIDGPPVLAVRLQELFGLATTPMVFEGRVPLLLHLLSPARRPIQVTTDLESFWRSGYPHVKKELKGRYPKHAWPDDPLAAEPLRGVPRKPSPS